MDRNPVVITDRRELDRRIQASRSRVNPDVLDTPVKRLSLADIRVKQAELLNRQ